MVKKRSVYIGAKLRRVRRDLGLTQGQMARDLDVSPSYVALMERNQRAVTAEMLLRLAATYELELKSLSDPDGADHATRLSDALRDPLFDDIDFAPMETEDVAVGHPPQRKRLFVYILHIATARSHWPIARLTSTRQMMR